MTKFDAMFPAVGTPCSDEDIAKEMATLAKGNRGTGKDLAKNLSLATASLEFKFGVTNGLTIRNSSGEIEDGNYSSNEIADIFSNNGRVMRCLKDRVQQFDMQDAIMIPKLVDKTLAANSGKWASPTTDMLEDVKTLTLDAVKEYTSDTLKFDKANGTGRQDQHWLLKLIRNSCSSDLRDIVDKTFNELPVHQQGGSVYLKLIYDVVFNMTEPVIRVLQNWIKGFAKHGLYKVPGENVRSLYDAAWNIAKRLHEVEALPSDAAMDILTGLTKATNDDFTRPFKLLKDLSNQSIINIGHLKSKTTLERIKTYLSQALDSYVVHVVNSTWKIKAIHAFTSDLTCWNCGKPGHNLCSCAQSPVTKIALTRRGHPTARARSLVPANQAVPGEVVLDTRVASLESLQLVVRLSGSSMTNPMHGVVRVAGLLHTPPSLMTIGMPTRAHLFSMISIH